MKIWLIRLTMRLTQIRNAISTTTFTQSTVVQPHQLCTATQTPSRQRAVTAATHQSTAMSITKCAWLFDSSLRVGVIAESPRDQRTVVGSNVLQEGEQVEHSLGRPKLGLPLKDARESPSPTREECHCGRARSPSSTTSSLGKRQRHPRSCKTSVFSTPC